MLNRRRVAALGSAVAATAALLLVPAQASYADTIVLRNQASGQMGCIQPPDFEKDVQLTTAPCDGSNIQHWTLVLVHLDSVSTWRVKNFATGFCMHATSNRDFAVVDQIDCTSISNNNWTFPGDGTVRSQISTGGAPCLDLQQGPSTSVPKPIDVFHCGSNNAAQIFSF
jgi:hypothetical protein